MKHEFYLKTEFIKLGQLLKAAGIVDSGAVSKEWIRQGMVTIGGQEEMRPGRKIYPGDVVCVDGQEMEEIYVFEGTEAKSFS